MYGGGVVDTWNYNYDNYRVMAVTFLPETDNTNATKTATMRAHYTNSWSDYPDGKYGNWTCSDTQAMEDGTYEDYKPWTEADGVAQMLTLWAQYMIGMIICFFTGNC